MINLLVKELKGVLSVVNFFMNSKLSGAIKGWLVLTGLVNRSGEQIILIGLYKLVIDSIVAPPIIGFTKPHSHP